MILSKPLDFFGKSKVLNGLCHSILFAFPHLNHILTFNLNFLKPFQRKFLLRQGSIIKKLNNELGFSLKVTFNNMHETSWSLFHFFAL